MQLCLRVPDGPAVELCDEPDLVLAEGLRESLDEPAEARPGDATMVFAIGDRVA